MSDDLVERVARAMWEAVGADPHDFWGDDFRAYECQARAAIAVCMEEAAKVAESYHWSIGNTVVNPVLVAAAIRALVKEPQP